MTLIGCCLDPSLQVAGRYQLGDGERALHDLAAQRDKPAWDVPAPVIIVPDIFEASVCRDLIARHGEQGRKTDSGFMRDIDGKTVEVVDYSHKRRLDYLVEDRNLKQRLMALASTGGSCRASGGPINFR